MIVYHYHQLTGVHTGSSRARKSPREEGVYLIPAHATDIAPPFLPDHNHAAVFDPVAGQWAIVEDHRGKPCWDTSTKQPVPIADLGPLPEGTTLLEPGPYQVWVDGKWVTNAASLTAAKARKQQDVARERYKRETAGVVVDGVKIKTDRESQAAIERVAARVQRRPAAVANLKGANGWIPLTKGNAQTIADAVGDHVQACFDAEKAHCDAIEALADIAAIEGYDIAVGWPG